MKINNLTPQIYNNDTNKAKSQSFSGVQHAKKYLKDDFLKFNRDYRGTMTRDLFLLNAFIFLLGTRVLTSRDNDEKREVMIRDIPTIVIAVMGVPAAERWMTKKFVQPKTGFTLLKDGDSLWNKLTGNESKKVPNTVSYGKLNDFYVYNDELHTGFDGFSGRLDKLGGNLKKIYSSLGDDVKSKLSGFSNDNKEFMKQLNGSENKGLLENIKTVMARSDNQALKQAGFLKTCGKIGGFIATLVTIGICIPKLNIYITEAIHKNIKNHEEAVAKAGKTK